MKNSGDEMNQNITPLYNALKRHRNNHPISLHVPGHKNGAVFYEKDPYFKNMLQIDLTELSHLDDLHSPEGAILEGQQLLADFYGAEKSFFLVNGSTAGNLAMIMGTFRDGDIVFVQRNCHKSVLNGIRLAKAIPVFLQPEFDKEWGIAKEVSLNTLKEAYERYPECKGVILTYPNYYGMIYEIRDLIDFAHERNIPVLVDEAHGAHFIGDGYFPLSSLRFGADVVVQSAHKTLPAMTMGSFLHINSPFISAADVQHYLQVLQSSSPSYPIMASLDIARYFLATYTEKDKEYLREKIETFKRMLALIDEIEVLDYPSGGDPLKVTIRSKSMGGYEFQQQLEEEGVFPELADPYNVLFVLPILKEGMDYPFDEIVSKVKAACQKGPKRDVKRDKPYIYRKKENVSTIYQGPFDRQKEIEYKKAAGAICAETIIPYPPGIPLIMQGEKITEEDVGILSLLLETGARFQGGETILKGKIKVLVDMEDE